MDFFLGTDMQKDTVIHAIHSVSLDPTLSNKVVTIPDIQDVVINGESLGLGGYLDIGIIDTMKDLFVNFIGASILGIMISVMIRDGVYCLRNSRAFSAL